MDEYRRPPSQRKKGESPHGDWFCSGMSGGDYIITDKGFRTVTAISELYRTLHPEALP